MCDYIIACRYEKYLHGFSSAIGRGNMSVAVTSVQKFNFLNFGLMWSSMLSLPHLGVCLVYFNWRRWTLWIFRFTQAPIHCSIEDGNEWVTKTNFCPLKSCSFLITILNDSLTLTCSIVLCKYWEALLQMKVCIFLLIIHSCPHLAQKTALTFTVQHVSSLTDTRTIMNLHSLNWQYGWVEPIPVVPCRRDVFPTFTNCSKAFLKIKMNM